MRLFLDQMFRVELAERLGALGHDAVRASEAGLDRADDADILARAIAQQRVLITLNGHFGDWAVLPLSRHCGVIRVRARPTTTETVARLLLPFLATALESQFANQLVIIAPGRVRWIRTIE